jgi:hypothetical protein
MVSTLTPKNVLKPKSTGKCTLILTFSLREKEMNLVRRKGRTASVVRAKEAISNQAKGSALSTQRNKGRIIPKRKESGRTVRSSRFLCRSLPGEQSGS